MVTALGLGIWLILTFRKIMRNLKYHSILIIAILFYSVSLYSQSEKEPTLKGKKIIYVFGGWEGHYPKESVDVIVPKLRAAGAEVHVFDNLKVYTNKAEDISYPSKCPKGPKPRFNGYNKRKLQAIFP